MAMISTPDFILSKRSAAGGERVLAGGGNEDGGAGFAGWGTRMEARRASGTIIIVHVTENN